MSDDEGEQVFCAGVNEKFEKVLCKHWVKKINSHNKEDHRLILISTAQLYLAKPSILGNSLKIAKSRPWVNLMSIDTVSLTILKFNFSDISITIDSPYAKKILGKITVLFQEMFSYSYRYRFHFNFRTSYITDDKSYNWIMGLYLSICYSKKYKIDVPELYNIMKILKKHPRTIDLSRLPQDKETVDAFLSILEYTDLIDSIVIPGNDYFPIFDKLAAIASMKKNIKRYTIVGTNNLRGFRNFVDEISDSNVTHLSFHNVRITQQDLDYLILSPITQKLETLKFNDACIDEGQLSFIFKYGDRFTNLQKLVISNNKKSFSPLVWLNLKKFLGSSHITKLVLTDNDIDVYEAIITVCNSITTLKCLDLSGNNFADQVSGKLMQFTLPETVNELVLSNCKWTMSSLINILFCQSYSSECSLNVSAAYIVDATWDSFFEYLSTFSFTENYSNNLIWNSNPIDCRFIDYLSQLSNIYSLDFSGSIYSESDTLDIAKSLINMFKELNIAKFVMKGTPNHRNAGLLFLILPGISKLKTIVYLDISSNILSDDCLLVLAHFIKNNKQLKVINFSGCINSHPKPYYYVLDAIIDLDEIAHVKNIKNDIKRIGELYVDEKSKLNQKWKSIKERMTQDANIYDEKSRSNSEKSNSSDCDDLSVDWNINLAIPNV